VVGRVAGWMIRFSQWGWDAGLRYVVDAMGFCLLC
jgi:hypothetical protein